MHIYISKNTLEIKETPVVLQSTLQGRSQVRSSTVMQQQGWEHLFMCQEIKQPPVPKQKSATCTISGRMQSRQYENT